MKHSRLLIFALVLLASAIGFNRGASAQQRPFAAHLLRGSHRKVCDVSSLAATHCFAQVISDSKGNPAATTLPAGYGPDQLHGGYQLPTTSAKPATVAIVDAYDDPYAASDLATYNKTYGLPVFPACSKTVTTACFQKVNQAGGTRYPQRNSGWSLEISLDVQTVHQTCQNCKIILVEANSSSYTNLMAAVDRARLMGATVISNSYGSGEFSSEASYDSHFNYPGIAFLFSSGDGGYGPTYPAASPLVTAVGGTSLTVNSANAWQAESVWSGAGSGCSAYELKPNFQTDSGCAKRTIADVSADADPNTGAAVYDSFGYAGHRGWFQVGGTSLAAPLIAGIYGLTNNVGAATYANSVPYSRFNYSLNLHDITGGNNGSCGGLYLCQAVAGYDGPSGLGSPLGLGAF